jgi:lycopene beta-cyclase
VKAVPAWAWGLPVMAAILGSVGFGEDMTYAQFHFTFTLPWLAVLAIDAVLAGRNGGEPRARTAWIALGTLAVVAFVYTFPWDHHLVARGVWGYPPGRVLATLGVVPVEEAAFFVVQTLATGLVALALARRGLGAAVRTDARPHPSADARPHASTDALPQPSALRPAQAGWARAVPAAGALATAAVGLLLLPTDPGTYLGLILVWAAPVLALQWAFGADLLLARGRLFVAAVALPTIWLWIADRIAIGRSIWWIAPELTLGWRPLGLPVEEAVFFLVTNLLVVGGLLLATDARSWERLRALGAEARRRPWRPLLGLWVVTMVPTPLVPAYFVPLAYVSTTALAAAVLVFALERYGRRAWWLLTIALAFGWAVEVLGSRTGVPFGAYTYTAPGPTLWGVPLLVPIGWFAFSLIALAVASGPRARWWAPAALVAWDLGLDPLMVQEGFWEFERGAYFGVAWTNFLGWYVSGVVLMTLLLRVEPRLASLGWEAETVDLRLAYLAQAFLIGVGLAFYGLPVAGAVAAVAMLVVFAIGRARRRPRLAGAAS